MKILCWVFFLVGGKSGVIVTLQKTYALLLHVMGNGDKYLQWKSLKFDKSRLLRFDPNSLEFRI